MSVQPGEPPDDVVIEPRTATVVGGTYREICGQPYTNTLRGSGLRAAALLRSLGVETSLLTCVDAETTDEALSLAAAFGIQIVVSDRLESVVFKYETPITPPRWTGGDPHPTTISAAAANALVFGMVEADSLVEAHLAVLDPQHEQLDRLLAAVRADARAVVLNAHEARRLTGLDEIDAAGLAIRERGVDTVVIKEGALGGRVFSSRGVDTYGFIITSATRTIGSGDAFSAGFAHAWFGDPTDPIAAARFGARVAAAHSLTDSAQVTPEMLQSLRSPLPYPRAVTPRVYLAGPFFTIAERLLVDLARTALLDAGVGVFSPLHDIGRGGDEVARADLDGMADCDAVLALLDHGDAGTLFEVGWAVHAGVPVTGFVDEPERHDWTMLRGSEVPLFADLTSAVFHAAATAVRTSTATGARSVAASRSDDS